MNRKTTIFSMMIFFFALKMRAQETIKHVVKKGETVYQLSKMYNVDILAIYKNNPGADTVIRVGETLSFPKEKNKIRYAKPEIENGALVHWVAYGETKFGLSRHYHISIPQLEQLNPQIVSMLQAGQKLRLDNNENLIIVQPGETLFSISQQYGMSVEELTSSNSDRLQGILKSGQYLYVGKNKQIKRTTEEKATEENKGVYIVKTGDTKTSLSKKFGISIAELERLNPHIVPMLKVEDEIRFTDSVINSRESKSEEKTSKEVVAEKPLENKGTVSATTTEPASEKYVDYTIQPKETLFGLSKKAGITSEDLLALNPQLNNGVQIGMVIKMPENSNLQAPIKENDISEKSGETPIESKDNLSATLDKNTEKTLFFITPFNEAEFKELKNTTPALDKTLKSQVDFLNGAQVAIEDAKSRGLKIKVEFLKSKEIETQKELQNKIKQQADAVILISNSTENAEPIDAYSKTKTPFIIVQQDKEYLKAENIFNALPSPEFERKTVLKYLKKQAGKVIVIQDEYSTDLTKLINDYCPNSKYITVPSSGDIDIDELKKSLSSTDANFVVMNTDKSIVFLTTTTALLEKVVGHKIQLVILENSKIPDSEKVSRNRLTILKMLYPSMEISSSKSNNLIEEYALKNNQKPSDQFLKGYDVTLDTALRLFQIKSFKETAETIKSEQLTTKFDYKKNDSGSFSNFGISIMQYDENGVVKISN